MLLSTFELLFKSITPTPGMIPNSDRIVLQGYFLNIANPNNLTFLLQLRFNAITPGIPRNDLLVIQDTTGTNATSNLDSLNQFNFVLRAGDTGLVILQPNIINLNPNTANLEVRGYVEIFVRAVLSDPLFIPNRSYPLLVTPEHRGTFLDSPGGTGAGEFDQLISSLPTATGGALIDVDVIPNRSPITIDPVPTEPEPAN